MLCLQDLSEFIAAWQEHQVIATSSSITDNQIRGTDSGSITCSFKHGARHSEGFSVNSALVFYQYSTRVHNCQHDTKLVAHNELIRIWTPLRAVGHWSVMIMKCKSQINCQSTISLLYKLGTWQTPRLGTLDAGYFYFFDGLIGSTRGTFSK